MANSEIKFTRWPIQFIVTRKGEEIYVDCAAENGIEGVYISLDPSWEGENLWACDICGKGY